MTGSVRDADCGGDKMKYLKNWGWLIAIVALVIFASSGVLLGGVWTPGPGGLSSSFVVAVILSLAGIAVLVLFCLLLYFYVANWKTLLVGLSSFFVLLLAVMALYAGLYSLYGQQKNFLDKGFTEPSLTITDAQCVNLAPNLTTGSSGCLVVGSSPGSLGILDSFYLSLGNVSPAGSGIEPVSTSARVLVFGQMFTFVFAIFAFGTLFLAVVEAKRPTGGVGEAGGGH